MFGFLLRRVGMLIPTFIGVTLVAFFFIRLLPGDPILLLAGERGISAERYAALQHSFGFDQPVLLAVFPLSFWPVSWRFWNVHGDASSGLG